MSRRQMYTLLNNFTTGKTRKSISVRILYLDKIKDLKMCYLDLDESQH